MSGKQKKVNNLKEGLNLRSNNEIEKPEGKLGVLLPGLGAVGTTFITGVEAIRKQISLPFPRRQLVSFVLNQNDQAATCTSKLHHICPDNSLNLIIHRNNVIQRCIRLR